MTRVGHPDVVPEPEQRTAAAEAAETHAMLAASPELVVGSARDYARAWVMR
ncbi:MAG: hypothetical protein QOF20_2942, partial [Acidimicrobiaceae bacterium]|nr:hypothetical protein [Acidimicrobiaceae bacterium]